MTIYVYIYINIYILLNVIEFKKLMLGLILLIILVFPASVLGKREHPEKWYQEKWCDAHKGQVEVVLPDGSLVKSLIS